MIVEWDVPIETDDGVVLRADVFRPDAPGRYPVVLTYGPYAKGLSFQEGYPSAWNKMAAEHPDALEGSSNVYQAWEVVDPEKWVPDGYVCVRVDSRGAGASPGVIDCFSPRETRDYYECVEWAGTQEWSNGRVGLNGISYFAMNQWHVASLQPPHLAAIIVWEGAADWYRDATHHGGIRTTFWDKWYGMQVTTVQHGLGENGPRNPVTGVPATGETTLSPEELAANRADLAGSIRAHPLDDAYHRERSPSFDRVTVPLLSAGNWGGQGLHLRGNTYGYLRAASEHKWLEMHGDTHWSLFYADYGVDLQKRFFGHFLAGQDTGWEKQPPVQLQIRHVDATFTPRFEEAWPIPRTRWTRHFLDAADLSLGELSAPAQVTYSATGRGVRFELPALTETTEITGPLAAKLFVSSSTSDADLFLVVRVFDPAGEEVAFQGALDPHTPVAQGWLRASHRELDPGLSQPWLPVHTHTNPAPLVPGEVYELDVEILPTCLVVPEGYRITLEVRGRDYEHDKPAGHLSNLRNPLKGCGPFLHDDPADRPAEVFHNEVTIHTGGETASYLLLPVVPG
ncbi:CocE/NonD family hydrolase [Herbidospora sp. NBRC 101105]|uniref:CocE/NonD family hydrolase n=1 Tax=Herbidospora sp. NBRC 101105 TaxID=3032195 RepID=UPI0024A158B3|nr:CocE/NonD family hydrolase [Herbidospora sp. NBRC 101105]GLX94662.1 peptidase S15 [Herbidospora sp. NBRC 101105]